MLDLYPVEHMAVIDRAYEKGLIDEEMIEQESFTETLENDSPEESLNKIQAEMNHRLSEDVHKRLEKRIGFEDDWGLDDFPSYDDFTLTPVVRETEKIGRNEPCPCGSGKKYKKCCLP